MSRWPCALSTLQRLPAGQQFSRAASASPCSRPICCNLRYGDEPDFLSTYRSRPSAQPVHGRQEFNTVYVFISSANLSRVQHVADEPWRW